MRFQRRLKPEHGLGVIAIAPLVDVILLLLLFYMLSSFYTFQSGINVKLPKAVTSDVIKEENLIITITGEDVLALNGKVISIKDLKKVLGKEENKSRAILIKSDRRASVGRIVDVWDMCRNLGIEKINIATNTEN